MIVASESTATPSFRNGSVGGFGRPGGCRRSQLNSKWSVCPANDAGKITNSTSSIAMPMALMASHAERALFERVTKTFSKNASRGRARMTSATAITLSTLHQVKLIDLDRAPLAVDGDDNGQAYGSFGSGLGDDKNGKDLARQFLHRDDVASKGNHQQVDAIEHQLDRQQDADGV